MRVFVKICGLRTADMVRAAIDAGADAVGFVLAESPRQVSVVQAMELSQQVPPGILRVAVLRQPSPEQWQAVVERLRPDWIQTDAADFVAVTLPDTIEALPVYRDVPALDRAAVGREDRALFEATASGVGLSPDWDRAWELARLTRLVLAGGLDPGNVAAAIRHVRPWGVDVSSGVEVGGCKDAERIRAFVRAAKGAGA